MLLNVKDVGEMCRSLRIGSEHIDIMLLPRKDNEVTLSVNPTGHEKIENMEIKGLHFVIEKFSRKLDKQRLI